MKKYILFLFLLLSLSLTVAENYSIIEYNLSSAWDIDERPIQPKVILSEQCDEEFKGFFGQDVTNIMKDYCSGVNSRLIVVLALAMLIWLLEPKLKILLEQNNLNNFGFFIKWLGLGLLTIVMVSLWFSRGG